MNFKKFLQTAHRHLQSITHTMCPTLKGNLTATWALQFCISPLTDSQSFSVKLEISYCKHKALSFSSSFWTYTSLEEFIWLWIEWKITRQHLKDLVTWLEVCWCELFSFSRCILAFTFLFLPEICFPGS